MAHQATPEHIQKHKKVYWFVFGALLVLTALTVGVSYLEHTLVVAVIVAMAIAMAKGGLVAGYFMHLVGEKRIIFAVLLLTLIFFVALLFLPLLTEMDQVVIRNVS